MAKTYITGIRTFPKHERAPEHVIGGGVITVEVLRKFAEANPHLLTEYNGEKQIPFQILSGDNGVYFVVDEYKLKK